MTDFFWSRLQEVVRRNPDAIAIETPDASVAYGDLFAATASLGSRLLQLGVGRGDVVALAMSRTPEYVVGMLASWYAGAAFVPLDPSLPAARRAQYLRETRARVAVVSAAEAWQSLDGLILVEAFGEADVQLPSTPWAAEQTAYVVYSSGSSGTPKGVALTHTGLVSMLDAQISAFAINPRSRCLWVLSPVFDASVSDVGTALLAGACLHIDERDLLRDPVALLETLRSRRISHVDLPPALLPLIPLDFLPESLKTVVIGGEVCPVDVARAWARRVRLVNVYGPTEATVCTSLSICDAETWDRDLIGAPLPGVTYALRDDAGQAPADGTPGELWIAGACLAAGYVERPEMTALRFVVREGVRWYRTGDLCTRHPDGGLEFLGRIDRQVKVRGVLVAPEEVEAALLLHAAVRRVAVVPMPCASGHALVAVLEGDAVPDAILRSHMASRVPHPLIPARFEWRERLPTTSSGKPDLARLGKNVSRAATVRPRGEPPRTTQEGQLAELWASWFGEPVGIQDDFFSLGGDSLRMIELCAWFSERGAVLSPDTLVANPTIAALAAHLEVIKPGDTGMRCEELRALVGAEVLEQPDAPGSTLCADRGRHALVTGATGFLGSRVVVELLRSGSTNVLCLVRAADLVHGRQRVHEAIATHGVEIPAADLERVVPILGDIERTHLGLTGTTFHSVATSVDRIFHCAAQVSLMADCRELWGANVRGTAHLSALLRAGPAKAFHYASTLSVFAAADSGEGTFMEDDALEATQVVHGGYAQTKWAAEVLVRSLVHAGSTHIYRLGLLTGDSITARCAPNDWLARIVRGLAAAGRIPETWDPALAFDVTPVDYAAGAMVAMSRTMAPATSTQVVHLAGPRPEPFGGLVDALRANGVVLGAGDADCADSAEIPTTHAAAVDRASAALGLRRVWGHNARRDLDLFQATRAHFDDRRAKARLQGTGVRCPPCTPALLDRYVHSILTGRTHD